MKSNLNRNLSISLTVLSLLIVGLSADRGHAAPPNFGSTPTTISMKARNWNFLYGTNMPKNPTSMNNDTAWFFNFPDISKGIVGYLTQKVTGSLATYASLSATIKIATTGSPIFDYKTEAGNTCITPATARFYLQKAWNNDPYVRWWSNPKAFVLEATPGALEFKVDLSGSEWTDTWGSRGDSSAEAVAGFNSTLANISQIGFTFGGGCFFGHGVRVVGGTAQFIVTNVSLIKK